MDQMKAQLLLELKKSQEKKSSILCRQDYHLAPSSSDSESIGKPGAGADIPPVVESNDAELAEKADFRKEIAPQPAQSKKLARTPKGNSDTKQKAGINNSQLKAPVVPEESAAAKQKEENSKLPENLKAKSTPGKVTVPVEKALTSAGKKNAGEHNQKSKNKELEAVKANRVGKEGTLPAKTPVGGGASGKRSEVRPNNETAMAATPNPVLNQILGLGKSTSKTKKTTVSSANNSAPSENFMDLFDRQLAASFVCEMEEFSTPIGLANGVSKNASVGLVQTPPPKKETNLKLVNLFGSDDENRVQKKKKKNGESSTHVKVLDGSGGKPARQKSSVSGKKIGDLASDSPSKPSSSTHPVPDLIPISDLAIQPVAVSVGMDIAAEPLNPRVDERRKRKSTLKLDESASERPARSSTPRTTAGGSSGGSSDGGTGLPPRKKIKMETPDGTTDVATAEIIAVPSAAAGSAEKQVKPKKPVISVKSFAAVGEVQKKKKKDKKSLFPNPNGVVVCTECNEKMAAKTFLEHNYEEHNMLGWVVGSEKPSIKEQLEEFKFDSYVCKKCGTVYSANAYAGHVTTCDWDSENWCYTSKKGKIVKGVPPFLASGAAVACNSCDALVVGTAFLKHNYEKHNMLAWPCGDCPKISINQQLKLLGFVSFTCSICGKQLSSKLYAAHVLSCARLTANASVAPARIFPDPTEMVTCTGCDASMVASRFLGHNYQEHNMLHWVKDKSKRPALQEMLEEYRFEKYSCKNCKKVFDFGDFASHVEHCSESVTKGNRVKGAQKPIFPDPGLEVTCSECETKMPASEFLQHNFEEHNMLSWVEEIEEKPAIPEMLKEFHFPDYTCKECYKKFRANAFAIHVLACKGDGSTTACECSSCGKEFSIDDFHVHNYKEHGLLAKKKGSRTRMNSVAVWRVLQRRHVPLQCPRCLQCFFDIPSVKVHEQACSEMGRFQPEVNGTPKTGKSKKGRPSIETPEKPVEIIVPDTETLQGTEKSVELHSVSVEIADPSNMIKEEDSSVEKERRKKLVGVQEEALKFADCLSSERTITCSQCSEKVTGDQYVMHAYKTHNLRCTIKEVKGPQPSYKELTHMLNLSEYSCCICNSNFDQEEYLKHILQCVSPGEVECNMCNVRTNKEELWFHSYFQHGLLARAKGKEDQVISNPVWHLLISMGVPMLCPRCKKTATYVSSMCSHDKHCGLEKVTCPYCPKKYRHLDAHIQERHADIVNRIKDKRKSAQKAREQFKGYTEEPPGIFNCKQCEFTCADTSSIISHIDENHVDLVDLEDGSDAEISLVDDDIDKAQEIKSETPEKKKRGKKKTEVLSAKKSRKRGASVMKFTEFIDSDAHVTCSVCSLVLPGRYFLDHVYRKHNFRGWVTEFKGDKPTIREMILASKVDTFTCAICSSTFSSEDFYSHVISCVEKGPAECNLCQKLMTVEDFYFHNYYQHGLLARMVGKEDQKVTYVVWNKLLSWGVPMQCPRCLKNYTTEAGCVAHDKLCGKQKIMCQLCFREFKDLASHMKTLHSEKADLLIDTPRDQRKSAAKAMKNFKNYEEVASGFRCKTCDAKANSVEEIEKHCASEHGDSSELVEEHSDAEQVLESEEEGDHEIVVDFEKPPKVKADTERDHPGAANPSFPDTPASLKWLSHSARPVQSMPLAHERMKDYAEKHFSTGPLFDYLMPDPKEWQNGDTLDSYRSEPIPVHIASTMESKMIDAFTSDGDIVFCGDTVTDLAWCPNSPYLAVATDSSIQLWDTTDNSFKYAVVHSTERINSIEWCPSGGVSQGIVPRLGLIAIAAGGVISIIAMPHPDSVVQDRVYRILPNLTLTLVGRSVECMCLNWFPGSGHRKIAAGFIDGTIAVWNVSLRSSLTLSGNNMFPILTFLAHNSVVSSVSFCSEFDGQYIASCGMDKCTYIWDLDEVRSHNTPLMIHKTSVCLHVEWPIHWPHLLLTGDFGLNDRRSTYVLDVGFGGKMTHMVTQGSTAFSAKLNPWFDIIVHGTESGEVICAPLGNPNKDDRYTKPGTIRITEFGLDQESAHFIINDKPSHFYFRQEDCRSFPFKERDQGIQQISGLAWGSSPSNASLLAVSCVGGVLQILDATDVFVKMRQTKRSQ